MTTRAEEIAGDGPYTYRQSAHIKDLFQVVNERDEPVLTHRHEMEARALAITLNRIHSAAYKQGQQDRWIPVETKLPEKGLTVLVLGPSEDGDGIGLDALDPDSDGVTWIEWSNAHERYISCGVPGAVGPGEEATYTHWCDYPSPPNPEQR